MLLKTHSAWFGASTYSAWTCMVWVYTSIHRMVRLHVGCTVRTCLGTGVQYMPTATKGKNRASNTEYCWYEFLGIQYCSWKTTISLLVLRAKSKMTPQYKYTSDPADKSLKEHFLLLNTILTLRTIIPVKLSLYRIIWCKFKKIGKYQFASRASVSKLIHLETRWSCWSRVDDDCWATAGGRGMGLAVKGGGMWIWHKCMYSTTICSGFPHLLYIQYCVSTKFCSPAANIHTALPSTGCDIRCWHKTMITVHKSCL